MAYLAERISKLEERLQQLEDDKAIREVIARYGFNADQGRGEAFVQLFTEDGALDLSIGPIEPAAAKPGADQGPDPIEGLVGLKTASGAAVSSRKDLEEREVVTRYEGHQSLRGFITRPKPKSIKGMLLHCMGNNMKTEIKGDHAVAESYNISLIRKGSEFAILNAAVNRWTLQKVNGQWRIKECFRRRPGTEDYNKVLVSAE